MREFIQLVSSLHTFRVFAKQITACCGTMLVIALFHHQAFAQSHSPREYDIKAGFVLNFLKFTDFSHADEALTVCVIDGAIVPKSFAPLEKQSVQGKHIKIVSPAINEIHSNCDVVFIAKSASLDKNKLLAALSKKPVLTIGEIPEFTTWGGIINFFPDGARLRFEVNLDAAERAGLTMSSKLLRVAKIYRESE